VYVQKKSWLLSAPSAAAGAGLGLSPFALEVTVDEFAAGIFPSVVLKKVKESLNPRRTEKCKDG
jgi:hypothetical protein